MIGQTISHYKITAKLGASGMPVSGQNAIALFGLVLAIAVGALSPDRGFAEEGQFHLTLVEYKSNMVEVYIADVDGDGQDDWIIMSGARNQFMPGRFSKGRFFGRAMDDVRFPYWISGIRPIDIDTLPGYEIAVMLKDIEGDSAWVCIHPGRGQECLCQTAAIHGVDNDPRPSSSPGPWDGEIMECLAIDLDNDGTKELVVGVNVGYDCYPRGVYAYRYPSGQPLWEYLTPGAPYDMQSGDANSDGYPEIYFKSGHPDNGCEVGGRTDSTAYIMAIDHRGKFMWSISSNDQFDFGAGKILLCDCDADGELELYYSSFQRVESADSYVRVLEKRRALDRSSLGLRPFGPSPVFDSFICTDVDADDSLELIMNGCPSIVDPVSLGIEHDGPFSHSNLLLVADLDSRADAQQELVLARNDSLILLDSELREITRTVPAPQMSLVKAKTFKHPDGNQYLTVQGKRWAADVPVVDLWVYRIDPGPGEVAGATAWVGKRSVLIGIAGLGLGLLCGAALAVILSRPRSTRFYSAPDPARYERLLTSLTTFRHGQLAGRNLNRLAFLLGNLPDSPEKLDAIKPNLQSAIDTYSSFTSPQIKNIVESALPLRELRDEARRLEKDQQNLEEALGTTTALRSDNPHAPECTQAPVLIKEIKEQIKQITRFLERRHACELLPVIWRVIEGLSKDLKQQDVTLDSLTVTGDPSRRVFFSEVELAVIVEEVINNACVAMRDSPDKRLSISVDYGDNTAVVALSDTGKGFEVEDFSHPFERAYSTKGNAGGYGLYHARQEIEKFSGHIQLQNNRSDRGATVEIQLRVLDDE